MKVKCIKTILGKDDFGMSGLVFDCTEFEAGKEYEVRYDGYILSESNCLFLYKNHKANFIQIQQ